MFPGDRAGNGGVGKMSVTQAGPGGEDQGLYIYWGCRPKLEGLFSLSVKQK